MAGRTRRTDADYFLVYKKSIINGGCRRAENGSTVFRVQEGDEMIKIDKHIKVIRTKKSKYPFNEMVVGDSFFVDKIKPVNFRSAAYTAAKKLNVKFLVRKVDGGCRCWRIK